MGQTVTGRLLAEFLGTFVLVFGGCGSAILAASVLAENPNVNMGIGFLGVALAFGLTVLCMAYAVGHISGVHFDPAVTVGAALAGRVLYLIASGKEGFSAVDSGFATNGYGALSPDGYSLTAVLIAEFVLTAMFLYIILGATDRRAPQGFAPIAIGLALTLIHLISIPIPNTSVNPARSLGVARFAGAEPLSQVWAFILAPIAGAVVAGLTYKLFFPDNSDHVLER